MDVYEAIRARRTIRDFEDRQVGMGIIERIIDAGLKAPTNNHLRQWEFVIVNGKEERGNLLRVENMTSRDECEQMLDGFGMTDEVQRNMYREAMPRQFSMLYNAGCLILPFFKIREPLLQPSSLSSLNDFASIWCCIENMLLAAASEGLLGVTRIPMAEESEHIKFCAKDKLNINIWYYQQLAGYLFLKVYRWISAKGHTPPRQARPLIKLCIVFD